MRQGVKYDSARRWGRTSFEIEYRGEVVKAKNDDEDEDGKNVSEIFTGVMTHVCIDGNKRPTPIAPEFKKKMTKRGNGDEGGGGGGGGGGFLPRSKL